jgi:hypothetical protein
MTEKLSSEWMQANAHLFPNKLKRCLQDLVYAAETTRSYCHLELDVYGHHRLPLARTRSLDLHRHSFLTQAIRRWVFLIACLNPNYETSALIPYSTDWLPTCLCSPEVSTATSEALRGPQSTCLYASLLVSRI